MNGAVRTTGGRRGGERLPAVRMVRVGDRLIEEPTYSGAEEHLDLVVRCRVDRSRSNLPYKGLLEDLVGACRKRGLTVQAKEVGSVYSMTRGGYIADVRVRVLKNGRVVARYRS